MSFQLQTDQQVLESLGIAFESLRLQKGLQDADIMSKGGVTKDALNKFKKGENITSINLIRILRGIGVIDELEKVLQTAEDKPLFSQVRTTKIPKRILKKAKKQPITWGDEH